MLNTERKKRGTTNESILYIVKRPTVINISALSKGTYRSEVFPIKIPTFWGGEKFEKWILTILMKIQGERSMATN